MVGTTGNYWRALNPREATRAILVTLVCSSVLACIIVGEINEQMLSKAREAALKSTVHHAETVAAATQRELVQFDVISRAVRYAVGHEPSLSQEEYSKLVAPLIANSPSVLNVGRSSGFVIDRIYPLESNRAVLGLDYRTTKGQLASIEHVMRTGEATLIGPVKLIQGGTAFVQRTPYFDEKSSELSKMALGVISIIIDRDRLMSKISEDHGLDAYKIAIRKLDADEQPVAHLYGEAGVFEQGPVLRELAVNGGSWQIGLVPTAGWPESVNGSWLVWALTFFACGLVGFLLLAVWSMYRLKCITENQLRSAINSIDDGFALYDRNDCLVFANEKYRSYYDLSRNAIFPGNSFENILREGLMNGQYADGIGREEEWLKERLEAHRNPTEPVEQQLKDGRWLKIAETRSPEGNTVGFRVDVTELKLAREKAEAANLAKNNFLNMVSHELRTPLTSVIGYARFLENPDVLPTFQALEEAIAQGESSADQKRALKQLRTEVSKMSNRIIVSSDHLLGLINDILDRAKLDADTVSLSVEPLDISALVKSVTSGLSIKAAEKGIDLICDVEALQITADAKRLRQALINVIGNAIKFTETGHVSVTSEHDDFNVRIIVNDTGCGIGAEDQEKIFHQFVQVDSSVTRRNSGAGLGLAITRELIRLHGGDVEVSSELGSGTTFVISIPVNAQELDIAA